MTRVGGHLCIATLAIACSIVAGARADVPRLSPDSTVGAVLPGCRALIKAQQVMYAESAAFCSGVVDALRYVGELLPEGYCYAVPVSLPQHEVIGTLIREIEAVYPTVERELFKGVVVEILHFHWPCRPRE